MIRVLTPFRGTLHAITQNSSIVSDVYDISKFVKFGWNDTDQVMSTTIGMQAVIAGTGRVDFFIDGTYDGTNADTAITALANVQTSPVFAEIKLSFPYPLIRFRAVEDNTGTCTACYLWVGIPSDGDGGEYA